MAYVNCLQDLEIYSEIRVMPVKLQIAVWFSMCHSYFRKIFKCCLQLKKVKYSLHIMH